MAVAGALAGSGPRRSRALTGWWGPVDVLAARASRPVDGSSAAVFRVAFGLVGLVAVIRFFAHGWIDDLYLAPAHHFSYVGFEWVQPWPGPLMYGHFALLGVLAACIAVGYRYRLAALLFALGFTYVELIDKTTYLNHYYWVSLAGLLLVFLPLHRVWSVDAWRSRRRRAATVPACTIWLLRAQLAVVYVFAGAGKLNPDWLLEAMPLRIWLPQHTAFPLIGPLLDEVWVAYAMSWAGAAFDLTIVAWLLWPRSRPFAYIAVVGFHLLTGQLFMIGVFPWLMIAGTLIFFPPDWPRRVAARLRRRASGAERARPADPDPPAPGGAGRARRWRRVAVLLVALLVIAQVAVPMRHFLYPGDVRWNEDGYRFSWRVLLTEKAGFIEYRVVDAAGGRSWIVAPDAYLTPLQAERMTTQPDMILATAHLVRDDFRQRGYAAVEVYADAFVAFNGRPYARFIDPDTDLAREAQGVGPKRWILPAPG